MKISAFFLALGLAAGSLSAAAAEQGGGDNGKIVFYNWTAYIDQQVVDAFEKEYGVTVEQKFYQSADERDETLMRNGGKGFDVLVLTAGDLPAYIRNGWLAPLGPDRVPNLRHVNRRWLDPFPGAAEYTSPYLWGTTGLIYRSDRIDEAITSWRQFYEPRDAWKGHVMMIDQYRIGFGMALKALGHSFNTTDPAAVAEAGKLLAAQKPFVQTYGYLKTNAESGIVSGETWIGQTWSGDALLLQERNPAIRYVVPEEGGEIMIDYLALSAHAENPEMAIAFIDWLQRPENAATIAESLQFATTNTAAEKLLPESFRNNPVIYPPEAVLDRSEVQAPVPTDIQRLMISLWARLTN